MAESRLGRWFKDVTAGRDGLETVLTVIGILFLALSLLCAIGVAVLALSFFDDDLSLDGLPIAPRTGKGYGIVLLGAGAVVTFATGWWLAGRPMVGRLRERRRRG